MIQNSNNSKINYLNINPVNKNTNIINNYILDEKAFEQKITENLKQIINTHNNIPENKQSKLSKQRTLLKDIKANKEKSNKSLRENLKTILDSYIFLGIITGFTIFALFGTDINTIFLYPSTDNIFSILSTITFTVFLFEIISSSFCIKDYFLTFYFFMDLISCLSMLLEIDWIITPIIYEFIK